MNDFHQQHFNEVITESYIYDNIIDLREAGGEAYHV